MQYKKSGLRVLAALLALLLLAGCGTGAQPQSTSEAASDEAVPADAVHVSTVDEFLAAIGPNKTVYLEEGSYDLSTASDYGKDSGSSSYFWGSVWGEDGVRPSELIINGVPGLTLLGAGLDKCSITAVPRYADVIRFVGCTDLTVRDLTAGHSVAPGFCTGGVLRLEDCRDVRLENCGLYGCGTIGVDAANTKRLTVSGCRIYECSYEAVSLFQCGSVRVTDCDVYRHGVSPAESYATTLFESSYSDGVVIDHNRVHDNNSMYLLQNRFSQRLSFLSNEVYDNRFDSSLFQFEQYGALVDGCAFHDNGSVRAWVQSRGVYAYDVTGKLLENADFEGMSLRDIDSDVSVTPAPVSAAAEVAPGGEITVTTVDEFLAAIGPDRTILLDGALFDLSEAAGYGAVGGEYYFWSECYDGPQLVIDGVSGLRIRAVSDDPHDTTLSATPRYANVLAFRNCSGISLSGFTAGHTKEPGSCAGGVLDFEDCRRVRVEDMRLYGCGILGVQARRCTALSVLRTEIYECSQGAGQFMQCDGLTFAGCDVHDVPSPAFSFSECSDKTWNGEALSASSGDYDVGEDGRLVPFAYPAADGSEYHGSAEALFNPFAAEPARSYPAGSPQALFTAAVQQLVADGDWEALADRVSYPLQLFAGGSSYILRDRQAFLDSLADENFMNNAFNDSFRQRVAAASTEEYGASVFGTTCLDHLFAFACCGTQITEENLYITAISVSTPLWPG